MKPVGNSPSLAKFALINPRVLAICLGLAVLGAAGVLDGNRTSSDTPCPCDASAEHEPCEHEERPTDHRHPGSCNGNDCPDTCPNCDCCSGVGFAIVRGLDRSSATTGVVSTLTPENEPALGYRRGVFRPPRSRG